MKVIFLLFVVIAIVGGTGSIDDQGDELQISAFIRLVILPILKNVFELVFLNLLSLVLYVVKGVYHGFARHNLPLLLFIILLLIRTVKTFILMMNNKIDRDLVLQEKVKTKVVDDEQESDESEEGEQSEKEDEEEEEVETNTNEMGLVKRIIFFLGDLTMEVLSLSYTLFGILKIITAVIVCLWIANGFLLSPCFSKGGCGGVAKSTNGNDDLNAADVEHHYPFIDDFFEGYYEDTLRGMKNTYPKTDWIEAQCQEALQTLRKEPEYQKLEDGIKTKTYAEKKVCELRTNFTTIRSDDYRTILSDVFYLFLILSSFTFFCLLVPRDHIFDLVDLVHPRRYQGSFITRVISYLARQILILLWKFAQGAVLSVIIIGVFLHHPVIRYLVTGFKETRLVEIVDYLPDDATTTSYDFFYGMKEESAAFYILSKFVGLVSTSVDFVTGSSRNTIYCTLFSNGWYLYALLLLFVLYVALPFVLLLIKLWGYEGIEEDLEVIYEEERNDLVDMIRKFGYFYDHRQKMVIPRVSEEEKNRKGKKIDFGILRKSLQELQEETRASLLELSRIRWTKGLTEGYYARYILFATIIKKINVIRRVKRELKSTFGVDDEDEEEHVFGKNIRWNKTSSSLYYKNYDYGEEEDDDGKKEK